jgi:group I intron endonuclease
MYRTIPIVGIYKIENLENGKIYIGESKSIFKRWNTHLTELLAGHHHNKLMQLEFSHWGINSFRFSIIEICSPKLLLQKEKIYISKQKMEGKILYNAE